MEMFIMVADSQDVGYLKETLSPTPTSFPQILLRQLRDKYDAHLAYLKSQIRSNYTDRETVKDLKDTVSDIQQRRDDVAEMIVLQLAKIDGIDKDPDKLLRDRNRAQLMYKAFATKYPRG